MNRRSGLGKGLDSLIPKDVGSTDASEGMLEIPVSAISANEFQPRTRFDEEALVSLTDSIREVGVLQPILVRRTAPNQYALIAGERRWRAARRAGLPTVPAVIREVDDRRSLEHAIVENLHREDLHALDEASAYQRLIEEFGLTQEQVATRVGKSRSAVANTLRLFQLPGSVQAMVASGQLSAGHARALLGSPDRGLQESLAAKVTADSLNVRQVEDLVRGHVADAENADAADSSSPDSGSIGLTKPAGILELESILAAHLDTRVKVTASKGNGRMMVDFADLSDLERIFRVMMEGRPSTD